MPDYRTTHISIKRTTYLDTPANNYFARLQEKASPPGTIHLHSREPSYSSSAVRYVERKRETGRWAIYQGQR